MKECDIYKNYNKNGFFLLYINFPNSPNIRFSKFQHHLYISLLLFFNEFLIYIYRLDGDLNVLSQLYSWI